MVQLTYWEPPRPDDDPATGREAATGGSRHWRSVVPSGPAEIRHGYTLNDVHRLVMIAVHGDNWHQSMNATDRQEIAWSGMVEHLYEADERPDWHELIRAARKTIGREYQQDRQAHGFLHGDAYAGQGAMPNFQRFWWAMPASSPENPIVENVAAAQIIEALPRYQRNALLLLAACDDWATAERGSGLGPGQLRSFVSRARRAFLDLWHEGETPSRPWRRDQRVGRHDGGRNGQAKLTDDQVRAIRGDTRSCQVVGVEHGVSAMTVSRIRRYEAYRDVA